MNIFQEILDWSEVWALFIPLAVLLKYPKQPKYLKPVIIYLWLALIIGFVADAGWKLKTYYPSFYKDRQPEWLWYNNYLYNLHSIVRFACFSSFFLMLNQPFLQTVKKVIVYLAYLLILVNFIFFEDFFYKQSFSSRLLSTEAGLLLFFCLQYYLYRFQEESVPQKRSPDFWVVLGLSIYVVLNFFLFLFYKTLLEKGYRTLVETLWDLHNPSFIIFCIFIAKGFYAARHRDY